MIDTRLSRPAAGLLRLGRRAGLALPGSPRPGRRSRSVLIAAVFGFFAVAPAASEHVPPTPDGFTELETSARLFLRHEAWEPMVEATGRFEGEDFEFRYRSLTLGSYYRLHRNVKAGAFYRLQWGARHDDDWILLDDGGWEWEDSTDRAEQVLIGDVTPRFLLEFMPGENWVLALKNRYFFNTFNEQQSYLIRPQLTYFWVRDRRPVLNVSAAYGLYAALNFSDQPVYERAPYIDVLYHLTDAVKVNAGLARRTVHWSTSEDLEKAGDETYSVDQTSWLVRAGVIIRLDF